MDIKEAIKDAADRFYDESFYEDEFGSVEVVEAAEYQGKKVTLNKPFRTPGGPKKFAVYTTNQSGKVVIVRFGDPLLSIKRDDPKRRKAYFDRHGRDPGPRWKAKYWSHKMWRVGTDIP